MNSWNHAQSAAKKWGGSPEDYLPIEEYIDASKKVLGDVRHRSLLHHTFGVWVVQDVFGSTISVTKSSGRVVQVPTRLIAERHIIEDLGWLPSPADYLKNTPVEKWMSGSQRKEVPLSTLLLNQPSEV
ncbi:hypothetical protein AB0D68_10985 [Streptomyces sp. NPDC048212]|uniref:DUF6915 family protein n=1 Tax=Streptomyces sp. NPDC048212 TaxID=3156658 RepID=UPI0033EF7FAE